MKISKTTLDILNNFSNINNQVIISEGNNQRTGVKGFFAEAIFDEKIPLEFGIYDLKQFLSTLSIFKEPDFEFEDKFVIIKENNQQFKYRYSNVELIQSVLPPKDKKLQIKFDGGFLLKKDIINNLRKICNMLSLEYISIFTEDNNIKVKTYNKMDNNYTSYSCIIEEYNLSQQFEMILDINKLKILDGDYKVNYSNKKILQLFNQSININYVMTCEMESTFKD